MIYRIEHDVPLPDRKNIFPWKDMKVGDSFLVNDKTMKQMVQCAYEETQRSGRKFTVRTVKGGVRVWRKS